MPRAAILLGVVGVFLGLAAEAAAYGWRDASRWIPDLAVGWVLIASGVIGAARRPVSRIPWLLASAGVLWFLPNFASLELEPFATLAAQALTLHRGPLIHAVLSFPTGRLTSWPERAIVGVAYGISIVPALAGNVGVQATLGLAVIAAAAWGALRSIGRARRARSWAIPAAVALGLVLLGVAVTRQAFPSRDVSIAALTAYQLILGAVSIGLLAGLLREPWTKAAMTDLVVELGDAPTPSVREALARALGDPTLEVGYTLDGASGYVDSGGQAVSIPPAGTGRALTRIDVDGRSVGILVHDSAVLDDPALVRSVADAARLAASNAKLQAAVRAQIADVAASRRRLLAAEDDERQRIQVRLRDGTEDRLRAVAARLVQARELAQAAGDAQTVARIEGAATQLDRTLDDLRDLARGLHPPALEAAGLRGALLELAGRAPIPIDVDLPDVELPQRVASAAYFVGSEAIANVVKHARATRARINATIDGGRLRVEVVDDGVGGADPSGSGLRGLADRLDALGGTLGIESAPGTGTRLVAELPLDDEA